MFSLGRDALGMQHTVLGKILKPRMKFNLLERVTLFLNSFFRQKLLHHQLCFLLKQVCDRSKLSFTSLGREIPSSSSNTGQNQTVNQQLSHKMEILHFGQREPSPLPENAPMQQTKRGRNGCSSVLTFHMRN